MHAVARVNISWLVLVYEHLTPIGVKSGWREWECLRKRRQEPHNGAILKEQVHLTF